MNRISQGRPSPDLGAGPSAPVPACRGANATSFRQRLRRHLARLFPAFLAPFLLAACAGVFYNASPGELTREIHVAGGPPELTLFTFVDEPTGFAWHSGLMINASHRVLYDPAAFWSDGTDERHRDVRYGFDDARLDGYLDRVTGRSRHVLIQSVEVPAEVAEQALESVLSLPARMIGECAHSVADVLRDLPGFTDLPSVVFPIRLSAAFARLPAVRTERYPADAREGVASRAAITPPQPDCPPVPGVPIAELPGPAALSRP